MWLLCFMILSFCESSYCATLFCPILLGKAEYYLENKADSKVIKKGHILAKKGHFLCDISVFKEKKLFFLDFKRKSEKQTHFLPV